MVSIDLKKAIDTESRRRMWYNIGRLGYTPNFLNMAIQLQEDKHGQVCHKGDLSEPFSIMNGVKQGCVLASTLFIIFFIMMFKHAAKYLDDDGVSIRHRLARGLFNLGRLKSHTKTP